MRYTRDQLLDIFKQQRDAGDLNSNIAELYVGEGDALVNGASAGKWGRREESDDMAETICWEKLGSVHPLGLVDMTEEEREVFGCCVIMERTMSDLCHPSSLRPPLTPRSKRRIRRTTRKTPITGKVQEPASLPSHTFRTQALYLLRLCLGLLKVGGTRASPIHSQTRLEPP